MATVITSLASAIPVIGNHIVSWLWGGFSVDNPTLNRFYSFHYLFPFLLAALRLAHLAALHQYGSTNPLGINASTDLVDFYPYFYVKDLVAILFLALFACFLVGFYPEALGHPDNNIPANPYSTPAHIVPEYNCSLWLSNKLSNNPTLCEELLITPWSTRLKPVKMTLLNGQFARKAGFCDDFFQKNQETKRTTHLWQLPSLQRLNVGHPDGFFPWLAGVIDGDGCFYFGPTHGLGWQFRFKIGQSNYNYKLLAYLKKKLGCGSISRAGKNHSQYLVLNPEILYHFLVNHFDFLKVPFLTRKKAWQYLCFKEALSFYMSEIGKQMSLDKRNDFLKKIKEKSKTIPESFIIAHSKKNRNYPSKGWVLGFTEAEGSFYLNEKKKGSLVHCVSWAQKNEKVLLECLAYRLYLTKAPSLERKSKDGTSYFWYKLQTRRQKRVESLIPFFEFRMKGMKAVEFRFWARSYRKWKGNFLKLNALRSGLRQSKKHASLSKINIYT